MIDMFALVSGFAILGVSALVAFAVRKLLPAALIVVTIVVLAAVAAVNFGLFERLAPLLVIYVNAGLMGGLGGFLYAKQVDAARDEER